MKRLFSILGLPLIITIYAFIQGARALAAMNTGSAGPEIRLLISILGMWTGALAFIGGIVALLLGYMCARSSRRSQNTLIRLFTLCRRLLPFMMVGLIIFCGLASVCVILSELVWLITTMKLNGSSGKVILFSASVMGGILWMLLKCIGSIRRCFASFKTEDSVIEGRNITAQQAPEFWRWVSQLAEQGQVIKPDNIVVGFFDCFYVTANNITLTNGERLTGNTLYFPLTYASLMSQQEIAAVIGHELGHFTGEDTQYSLRFIPLYVGLQNSLNAMANNSRGVSYIDRVVLYPALEMGIWFLQAFHETVRYWSRIREFAADSTGARVASAEALASSLLRISALDEVIQLHLQALTTGKVENSDVLQSLLEEAKALPALDVHSCLEYVTTHPTDSHPTTRLRIEALKVSVDETLLREAARPVSDRDYQAIMSWFSLGSDFVSTMSKTLTEDIAREREEVRAHLAEQAGLALDTQTFWLRMRDTWYFLAGAFIFHIAGTFILINQDSFFKYVGWFFVAMSIMFALLSLKHYRSARKPLYTFTPQGIQCSSINGVLEWTWIEPTIHVEEKMESMRIVFYCYPGVQAPKPRRRVAGIMLGGGNSYVIIIPDTLFIVEAGQRVKIEPDVFIKHFHQYLQSAHARAALNQF